jgi:hypothetical protein
VAKTIYDIHMQNINRVVVTAFRNNGYTDPNLYRADVKGCYIYIFAPNGAGIGHIDGESGKYNEMAISVHGIWFRELHNLEEKLEAYKQYGLVLRDIKDALERMLEEENV